jgi:hypothetical protein
LLQLLLEPFHTAKKNSSSGRNTEARSCRLGVDVLSSGGLDEATWSVIGLLRRTPWDLSWMSSVVLVDEKMNIPFANKKNPEHAAVCPLIVPTDCITFQHGEERCSFAKIEPPLLIVSQTSVGSIEEERN